MTDKLSAAVASSGEGNTLDAARFWLKKALPAMQELRKACDQLERITDRAVWPFPTYGDLLFHI